MLQNPIQQYKVFEVQGIDYMGPWQQIHAGNHGLCIKMCRSSSFAYERRLSCSEILKEIVFSVMGPEGNHKPLGYPFL